MHKGVHESTFCYIVNNLHKSRWERLYKAKQNNIPLNDIQMEQPFVNH